MTKFSRVLNDLLAEHGFTQMGLSQMSGVDQVKISRLVNSQARPNRDDLTGLLASFIDPNDKYRLARAHIADEIPEPALKLLEVELATRVLREGGSSLNALPLRVQKALDFLIREYPHNPSIGDVMLDIATALGWEEQAPIPTKYPSASE